MGLFAFIKEAGEKLFGTGEAKAAATATDPAAGNATAAQAIHNYIVALKLAPPDLGIKFDGEEKTNVEEYCVSEGWIRVAVGKTVDRKGNPLTIKLKGKVEPYLQK